MGGNMELYGKEIGFRRSVWAENELKRIAPDGKVGAFLAMMNDPDPFNAMNTMIDFCRTMAAAYENWKAYEAVVTGAKYTKNEWAGAREAWENLSEEELMSAVSEALHAWNGDAKQEVEAVPTGKNAKRQSKAKS